LFKSNLTCKAQAAQELNGGRSEEERVDEEGWILLRKSGKYRRKVWQDVIASMNKLQWNTVGHKFCGEFIRMVVAEDFKLFLADRSYRLSEYHHCESWGLVLDRLWEDAVKGLSGILKILKTVPTKIVHKSLLPMPSTWDTIRGGIEFSKRGLVTEAKLANNRMHVSFVAKRVPARDPGKK
jgi:hypothetical protein